MVWNPCLLEIGSKDLLHYCESLALPFMLPCGFPFWTMASSYLTSYSSFSVTDRTTIQSITVRRCP